NAKDSKEVGISLRYVKAFGLISQSQIRGGGFNSSELFEDCVLLAPIVEVRRRYLNALTFGIEFLDRNDAVGLAIGQTSEHYTVYDAEDGGASANSQRQSQDHYRCEPGMFQ